MPVHRFDRLYDAERAAVDVDAERDEAEAQDRVDSNLIVAQQLIKGRLITRLAPQQSMTSSALYRDPWKSNCSNRIRNNSALSYNDVL